jgi:beta-xylosidase
VVAASSPYCRLAALPSWAAANATWAPAVLQRDGGYVVYYTVREAASQRQCISRAVAASPAGPFRDDSTGPLLCQRDLGGSIDPSPFVDADGRAFLLWKSEGLGGTAPTIWSQRLTTDGLALSGTAQRLLSVDRAFERGVVEAPTLLREGSTYFLLYAAADWNSRNYSTAYATCVGPAGPCTKPADGRVLTSGPRIAGPGGRRGVPRQRRRAVGSVPRLLRAERRVSQQPVPHVARVRVIDGRIVIDATT